MGVRDEGPGLDVERLRDLVRRHRRADHASKNGAGLGLAICSRIIEAHEGEIDAQHSPLGGLLMTVRLPLRREEFLDTAISGGQGA